MHKSVGELVDQLITNNIKLFIAEGRRRELSTPDSERLAASDMVTVLNAKRNTLVTALDEQLAMILENPSSHSVFRKAEVKGEPE